VGLFRRKVGPPDAAAAMSRVLVLKYQIVTGMATPPPDVLSGLMQAWGSGERQRFLEESRQRQAESEKKLRDSGLWLAMTSDEQEFIRTLPSAHTQQALINVSWLMESAECLLWSLGLVDDLPPYDAQADPNDLKRVPSSSVQELLRNAKLRPRDVISKARDAAELWHWRSRTRQIQEGGESVELPEGLTLPKVVQMCAEKAAAEGLFRAPLGDDFPAFGRPYREISSEEWSQATSIAMERHKALNWLCGHAPGNRWDETPTDT
jgi:hypothetical protein